jgi:hypothetical protein
MGVKAGKVSGRTSVIARISTGIVGAVEVMVSAVSSVSVTTSTH